MISIEYFSGTTIAGSGFNWCDANGDTGYATKYYSSGAWVDEAGSTGNYFPTLYIATPSDTAEVYYLMALVGTFADASGVIVGDPFFIGNGPLSIAVPMGAVQLQLGINDDYFSDNSGSLYVRVSGAAPGPTPTPEPTTMLLLGFGLIGLVGLGRKV